MTPWTAACQASLSLANYWSLLKLMSIESVIPSDHLIFCCPLLLLPSIFPSIRVFSNEAVLCIRWPKYWSFSFNISPSNEYLGLISFRIDWLDLHHTCHRPTKPRCPNYQALAPQLEGLHGNERSLMPPIRPDTTKKNKNKTRENCGDSQKQLRHVQSLRFLCTRHSLCLGRYISLAPGRDLSVVTRQGMGKGMATHSSILA